MGEHELLRLSRVSQVLLKLLVQQWRCDATEHWRLTTINGMLTIPRSTFPRSTSQAER